MRLLFLVISVFILSYAIGQESVIEIENPSFEEYWQELEQTVTQGGQFDNIGGFTAPFTWTAEHPQDWDAFETYFVLGPPRPVFFTTR